MKQVKSTVENKNIFSKIYQTSVFLVSFVSVYTFSYTLVFYTNVKKFVRQFLPDSKKIQKELI